MLAAIAIKIEVVAVSRLSRRLLTVMMVAMMAILAFAVSPETVRAADAGVITISGDVATQYDAYQLFSATVADKAGSDQKVATDLAWANDAVCQAVLPVLHDAGLDSSASTAQAAAEWMNADGRMTTALTAKLARFRMPRSVRAVFRLPRRSLAHREQGFFSFRSLNTMSYTGTWMRV